MKYLFLYTELAEYTLVCLRALKDVDIKNEIVVIHFPVNPEAPFKFDFTGIGTFKEVVKFQNYKDLFNYVSGFAPDKIICSGWINKNYVRVCLEMRKRATCILTMDNHWNGSFKQRILAFASKFTLKNIFKYIWVPGKQQEYYAKRMGFKPDSIRNGFYSCDVDKFELIGANLLESKSSNNPSKRMLCVARYIPAKNYTFLWKTFIAWQTKQSNDWELWCVGMGEDFDKRMNHSKIKHLGFLQLNEWDEVLKNTSVFILPSMNEPWGVVVHEFAAAGYPLILSNKVGAADTFLKDSLNGWIIDPFDEASLIDALDKMNSTSTQRLSEMGKVSNQLAQLITPRTWAATLTGM